MQLQHVNVKLLVQNPEAVDLEPLISIFLGWIQNQSNDELLLDIADYRHVQAGPGVVLIGHQGNYSVDNANNRLGIRYNRKSSMEGTNQDRLKQAARSALIACRRLESDSRLGGKLRFNGQEIELSINDRLIAPNCDATREAFDADFQLFCQSLFGNAKYSMVYGSDLRNLFGVSVKAAETFSTADLLERLS